MTVRTALDSNHIAPGHNRVIHASLLREARAVADWMATWRSGYAADCKSVYIGSNPVVASNSTIAAIITPNCAPTDAPVRRVRSLSSKKLSPLLRAMAHFQLNVEAKANCRRTTDAQEALA